MSDLPYEGATPEQLRHPLVHEFLAIHNMFRGELSKMLRFVDDLIAGEAQLTGSETTFRVQAVIRAGMQYTQLLHYHHHGESSMLFPALKKEDPLMAPVVDRLEAEHDEIAVLIDHFSDAVHRAATVDLRVLDTDLRRLSDALQAHLAYEETHICPLLTHFSHWPFYAG